MIGPVDGQKQDANAFDEVEAEIKTKQEVG